MKKLLYIIILAALTVACSQENPGARYEGTDGFAFGAPVLNVEVGSEEGTLLVPIYRTGFGVSSAPVTCTYETGDGLADATDLFRLMTPNVLFADGRYESAVQIRVTAPDRLATDKKYRFTLTIADQVSPAGRASVAVTAQRKLTFERLGKCSYFDACVFDNAYETDIYKAAEADIYRVMDPYTKGLIAEEYAANGFMDTPPEYVEFKVEADGRITYDPFFTGMTVPDPSHTAKHMAWGFYPSSYTWGRDFSDFDRENRKLSDTVFQLYPVYCLPTYYHGYLNEGAYPLTITLL